jgi:hypothetical protein
MDTPKPLQTKRTSLKINKPNLFYKDRTKLKI